MKEKIGFGTVAVYLTAISTTLSAILFLRFGFAVGTVGFLGTLLLIAVGHLITVPTALAFSEIATNQRVEGGGEYFLISRSFGINIGATIGLVLYIAQAISIAFYVIAFAEAFEPFFTWINGWSIEAIGFEFPRQMISIPVMVGLIFLIQRRGLSVNLKILLFVAAILFFSLLMFFFGDAGYVPEEGAGIFSIQSGNITSNFSIVFAIVFPAFAGITAGAGLSGNLKNGGRSIPSGTIAATFTGLVVFILVAYKFSISASIDELSTDYYLMRKITALGFIVIPLALAATSFAASLSFMLVAPRTLQALAIDGTLPVKSLNRYAAKGKGKNDEPAAATTVTNVLAICFVIAGEIDTTAHIITTLLLVAYGSICLVSFLYHFSGDPSYRPMFRSRWYLSLIGFVLSVFVLFKIDWVYASVSVFALVMLYLYISRQRSEKEGVEEIFRGVIFQSSRRLQIHTQKITQNNKELKWRPSVVCVSKNSFESDKAMRLLEWVSDKYGFGTYIHLIEDYFTEESNQKSREIYDRLLEQAGKKRNFYIDTMISPSFKSAIAQTIQLPGISGMPNNIILFEFDKLKPEGLYEISENLNMAKTAGLDIGILATSSRKINFYKGIDIWINIGDSQSSNLMILLSYVIISHNDWNNCRIRVFEIAPVGKKGEARAKLMHKINTGRLPIAPSNIEIIEADNDFDSHKIISERSVNAGLTILGFQLSDDLQQFREMCKGFENMGDILFINANNPKSID